jgi:hypothetical protein
VRGADPAPPPASVEEHLSYFVVRRIAANIAKVRAFAEGLIAVSFIRVVPGRRTHHDATDSTWVVFYGPGRVCSHRLHSHAEAKKAPLKPHELSKIDFEMIDGAFNGSPAIPPRSGDGR